MECNETATKCDETIGYQSAISSVWQSANDMGSAVGGRWTLLLLTVQCADARGTAIRVLTAQANAESTIGS